MELIRVHKTDSGGLKPQVIVSVPSVNKFLGAFAELYNGVSLCSCGERTLYIAISLRSDGQVVASNCVSGEHKKYQIASAKYKKEEKWFNYIKGAVAGINGALTSFCGLTITMDGNLLECDSVSVDSALTAGLIFGLNNLFKLKMSKEEMTAACCKVFTSFCSELPPVLDIKTIIQAEKDKFVLVNLEGQTFSLLPNPFKKSEYKLLLVDGNIASSAMKEELAYTKESLKQAAEKYRMFFNRISMSDFNGLKIKEETDGINEEDRKHCQYLINEFRIASSAEKVIKTGDFVSFGKLFSRIEKSIKDELELTCPEIDWLIKRSSGLSACLGSCMIFNGLGGLVAMIIRESEISSFTSYLEDYGHIFGFDSSVIEFAHTNTLKLIDLNSPALQN